MLTDECYRQESIFDIYFKRDEQTCFKTNLDSILKSRDITLPTEICLVKPMVFPVIIYGCESWTLKKDECQRSDAFELCC